jgi:hypothetical protein
MSQQDDQTLTEERMHRESVDFTEQVEMPEDDNVIEILEELEHETIPEPQKVRRSSRLANRKTTSKIKKQASSKKRTPEANPRRQVEQEQQELDEQEQRSGITTLARDIISRERMRERSRRSHRHHDHDHDHVHKMKSRKHRKDYSTEDEWSNSDAANKKRRNPAKGKKSRHSKRKRSLPSSSSSSPSYSDHSSESSDSDSSKSSSSSSEDHHQNRHRSKSKSSSVHTLRKKFDDRRYGHRINQIPEFVGSNWENFRNRVRMVLDGLGLGTYLLHTPTRRSGTEMHNDRQAKSIICLKLHPNQYELTEECTYTVEVWQKLLDGFQPKPINQRKELFRQFLRYRKGNNQSMRSYLDKLNQIHMTLRAKGCDISDDCYIEKVLEGLPDSYANTIEAANASQMTEKADLNNLLLGSRMRNNAPDASIPKAMFSEKKGQGKNKNQGKPKPRCTHCKKKGHVVNDCFILHPELKNSQSSKQSSRKANMATTNQVTSQPAYESEGGTVYGMMAQMNMEENDDLLIDCGANICVTNDRGLLTNYIKLRRHQTIAGCTGHDMKAEGFGELRLLQGKLIIPHVYYSSDCMKTLISTRTLAQIGIRTMIEDDGMILSDKAGRFEMKPYEENGLHYIPRKWAMTASANATISMEEAHRRFGHASTERLRHLEEHTTGLTLSTKTRDFCDTCAFAKSRVKPFPKKDEPNRREHSRLSPLT